MNQARRRNPFRASISCAAILIAVSGGVATSSQPAANEVTFVGAGGLALRGTLLMPPGPAPPGGVPAMLLLPGSGPTDRNGNQPPALVTDLLLQIAQRLADNGVASLRFDKRAAHVHSKDWPKSVDAIDAFFSYENFVGDAAAAFRHLRSTTGVNRGSVAILGHSEGGLFALQIARNLGSSEERPAGLILAATPGRVLDVVLREQVAAALAVQTSDAAVREVFLGHLERGITAVKAKAPIPTDLPPGLAPLINPTVRNLLFAYFTVDPAELAKNVRGPVLILQGANDAQVSAERDAPVLLNAFKARPDTGASVNTVIVPAASHNFKAGSPGDGATSRFGGPVLPAALQAIVDWTDRFLVAQVPTQSATTPKPNFSGHWVLVSPAELAGKPG